MDALIKGLNHELFGEIDLLMDPKNSKQYILKKIDYNIEEEYSKSIEMRKSINCSNLMEFI